MISNHEQGSQSNQAKGEFYPEDDGLSNDELVNPIRLYLNELAAVPLLTPEQEIDLAKKIEAGKKTETWMRGKSQSKIPDKKRQKIEDLIKVGELAKDSLTEANARLVVSIAKKYQDRGLPLSDLIQEGNMGLMKAANKFDHHRGFKFSTYATWWIRQAVTRAIIDQGRTIRVPTNMHDDIQRLYKVKNRLEGQLGRTAKVEELAAEMNKSPSKIEFMLKASLFTTSLDKMVGNDKEDKLGIFVEDVNSANPEQEVEHAMSIEELGEILDTLSQREADILRLRYGLENGKAHTLEEIGKKLDVSRERIRQLEGLILKKLKHLLDAKR